MRVILGALGLLLVAQTAAAQGDLSERARRWDFAFQPRYQFGTTIDYAGGTQVSFQEDWAWGFIFNYGLDEKLALGMEFGWNSPSYMATVATDVPGAFGQFSGYMDTGTTMFNATYHLMPKRITPYIIGGLGWTWVDTNVPSSLPSTGCWWDPWYGYICVPYQTTYGGTVFAWKAGAGLRIDSGRSFVLRLGYAAQWGDIAESESGAFNQQIRLDIGGMD